METQTELDVWNELDKPKGGGDFFKPEIDKPYKITIASARAVYAVFEKGLGMTEIPKEQVKELEKDGKKPKLVVIMQLATVNGQPTTQTWTSGSFSVMREVNKYRKQGILASVLFLLKRKDEDGKTKYIFEALEVGANAQPHDIAEVGI